MNIECLNLGIIEYGKGLEIQKKAHKKTLQGIDSLLLLEHPKVITLGKHANKKNILATEQLLKEKKIKIYQVERGGDVTLHNLGQLIGYPIINLKNNNLGVKKYIHKLEQTIIELLKDYNIQSRTNENKIGVWAGDSKIASIGIKIKNNITMHGFALYVKPNLEEFNLIKPCGMKKIKITSITSLLKEDVNMEEIKKKYAKNFLKIFNYN